MDFWNDWEEVQSLLQQAWAILQPFALGSLSCHSGPFKFSNSTGPQCSSSDIRSKSLSLLSQCLRSSLQGCFLSCNYVPRDVPRSCEVAQIVAPGRELASRELGLRTPLLASTTAFLSSSVPPSSPMRYFVGHCAPRRG